VLYDRYTESRDEIGEKLVRERGALLVPPFDDELIMAGAAPRRRSFWKRCSISTPPRSGLRQDDLGVGDRRKHLRPQITVYGVEPETGNDTVLARPGRCVSISIPHTIADGLQVSSLA
jgi:threonine dehydratase